MILDTNQVEALDRLRNGSILCADVGVGKSRTAIAYYFSKVCGGKIKINENDSWGEMTSPRDLYIITTAKKRNDKEWKNECILFDVIPRVVDSWNNIKKYKDVQNAFFIFDEQRVTGYGTWSKSFISIARRNEWILLTATPGDKWIEYLPVFMAHGFYKTKTEFDRKHCVYDPYKNYPSIRAYLNEKQLEKYRDQILVRMEKTRQIEKISVDKYFDYNKKNYMLVYRDHWNPFDNEPINETGKWLYLLRRVVNSEPARLLMLRDVQNRHKRIIVFYNFNYELDALRKYFSDITTVAEWNGQNHDKVPFCDEWIYLVQYEAGSEGWNCITSNCIVFFSQSYSYKKMVQAAGRIDRFDTAYNVLYYYYFKSKSSIDKSISRALALKKEFNKKSFEKAWNKYKR